MYRVYPYPPPADGDGEPVYDQGLVDYRLFLRFGVRATTCPVSVVVIEDEGPDMEDVVGFAGVFESSFPDTEWDFHLFVWEPHQGGVVGYLLMQEVMARIPAHVNYFRTCVINEAMTRLLVKHFGFVAGMRDEHDHPEGLYVCDCYWHRPLAKTPEHLKLAA